MDTKTLARLNELILAEIEKSQAEGCTLTRIDTIPMADGSGRWAAIASLYDTAGAELRIRASAPAPANAPRWAQAYGWMVGPIVDAVLS